MQKEINGIKITCHICNGQDWEIDHIEMNFKNGKYIDNLKMAEVLTCKNCNYLIYFNNNKLPISCNI